MLTRTLAVLSIVLSTLLLPVIGTAAIAETIIGKFVGVHDGDTITLLDDSRTKIKIRLAEIDAPESHQPYGNRAKQELSELVTPTAENYFSRISKAAILQVLQEAKGTPLSPATAKLSKTELAAQAVCKNCVTVSNVIQI